MAVELKPDSGCKEATILSLSEEVLKGLDDLQCRLDCRFNRSPKKLDTGEGKKPLTPNVLDEIIENLKSGDKWLNDITTFISSEVLPKIN